MKFLSLSLLLLVSCVTTPTKEEPELPKKSEDSLVVFLDPVDGKDSNDGLSEQAPKKSLADAMKLLRHNMPDHLLLKRGSVLNQVIGQFKKSGRSSTEPIVLGTYGSGPRPKIVIGKNKDGVYTHKGGQSPQLKHIVISGLHFYGKDGKNAVQWLQTTEDLIIENCRFEHAQVNIQTYQDTKIKNVTLRNNVFHNSNPKGGHSQGIFVSGVTGLNIHNNVFDRNGWAKPDRSDATMFNHNAYLQYTNKDVVFTGNVVMRGSSHGVQMRTGGIADGNFFYQNAISILFGYQANKFKVTGEIKNNVILGAADINKGLPRGFGIWLENVESSAVIKDNLLLNADNPSTVNRVAIHKADHVKKENNIIKNWDKANKESASVLLKGYMKSLGLPESEEEFIKMVIAQDPRFSAAVLNKYFKENNRG